MGEAKRREPDKDKRVAMGIEKARLREVEREAEFKREQAQYREYLKANPKAAESIRNLNIIMATVGSHCDKLYLGRR